MTALITWFVLCMALASTISAAPVQQQSSLQTAGSKLQSDSMMNALFSTIFRNLFSSFGPTYQGYDHAKLESNNADHIESILKNLLDHHTSANNEASMQTGFANRVDYKRAMIEAIDDLPAKVKAEFLQDLFGGGIFSG